jgi:hypothetical protein
VTPVLSVSGRGYGQQRSLQTRNVRTLERDAQGHWLGTVRGAEVRPALGDSVRALLVRDELHDRATRCSSRGFAITQMATRARYGCCGCPGHEGLQEYRRQRGGSDDDCGGRGHAG